MFLTRWPGRVEPAEATQVQVTPETEGREDVRQRGQPGSAGAGVRDGDRPGDVGPGDGGRLPVGLDDRRSAVGVSVSLSGRVVVGGVRIRERRGRRQARAVQSVPVADGAMVAVAVKVALPAGASVTPAAMLPAPQAPRRPSRGGRAGPRRPAASAGTCRSRWRRWRCWVQGWWR